MGGDKRDSLCTGHERGICGRSRSVDSFLVESILPRPMPDPDSACGYTEINTFIIHGHGNGHGGHELMLMLWLPLQAQDTSMFAKQGVSAAA
jgi:hypothetical protein